MAHIINKISLESWAKRILDHTTNKIRIVCLPRACATSADMEVVSLRLSPERPHLIYKGGACHQRASPPEGYQIRGDSGYIKNQMVVKVVVKTPIGGSHGELEYHR